VTIRPETFSPSLQLTVTVAVWDVPTGLIAVAGVIAQKQANASRVAPAFGLAPLVGGVGDPVPKTTTKAMVSESGANHLN
jgi:hypothetical protein